MKIWTVVIEMKMADDDEGYEISRSAIEGFISESLSAKIAPTHSFRIMETCDAPYGPQHSGGVFLKESQIGKAGRVITAGGDK